MSGNYNDFEWCPKTYSFFYNFYEKDIEKKYYIIEGYHTSLPFWHDSYDEDTFFNYDQVGSVEIHKGKLLKVTSRIDGGYSDDEIDYYINEFAGLESENENGLKSKLPDILRVFFENYIMFRDTAKGTVLTLDDVKNEYIELDYDLVVE
jgi:hypothetical protein